MNLNLKQYNTPFNVYDTKDMIRYFVNKEAEYQLRNSDYTPPTPEFKRKKIGFRPASAYAFGQQIISSLLP